MVFVLVVATVVSDTFEASASRLRQRPNTTLKKIHFLKYQRNLIDLLSNSLEAPLLKRADIMKIFFFTVLSQAEANFLTRKDDAEFLYGKMNFRQYQLQTQQPQFRTHDGWKNTK